jgi:hypothetical protein
MGRVGEIPAGSVSPATEKALPVNVDALITSGALPDEVRVTVFVVEVLSWTVPKFRLVELIVSPAVAAFSCSDAVLLTLLAVAVTVAVCAVVTAEAVAVKGALADPLATVTDAGTETALLLLARFTVIALVAADVRLTVQASVAAPLSELLLHETALSAAADWPVPLRLTVVVAPVAALLVKVSAPLAAPAAVGSKAKEIVAD